MSVDLPTPIARYIAVENLSDRETLDRLSTKEWLWRASRLWESFLIDPEISESCLQQWCGDAVRVTAADQVAQDMISLDGRALAQIAIHRGGQRRSRFRHRGGVSCKQDF